MMSDRQETISNVLGNITTLLQEMWSGPQLSNFNTNNSVCGTERATLSPPSDGRQQVQQASLADSSRTPENYENRC